MQNQSRANAKRTIRWFLCGRPESSALELYCMRKYINITVNCVKDMDDLVRQKCHLREKDAIEFNLTGNGRAIAERNSAISKDSAEKAKITFA